MRERNVGEMFKRVFDGYPTLNIRNNAESGWPDRLVQLGNSRIVFVEMKHVVINQSNYFRLTDFRNDQASFFAKWQKADGKCCLFLGITNTANDIIGYGLYTTFDWREWLDVNKSKYTIDELSVFDQGHSAIKKWFANWVSWW